eukprot:jgi/Tetstr1/446803/TSEL_034283.t1
MWAVELRAAHTRVVDECGDAVLEDLAGPLASALKLLPSKCSHVARAGCSAAGAEPASAMRSAADLQAIPHYSEFPLHSMPKVQETLSHRIHTGDMRRWALMEAAVLALLALSPTAVAFTGDQVDLKQELAHFESQSVAVLVPGRARHFSGDGGSPALPRGRQLLQAGKGCAEVTSMTLLLRWVTQSQFAGYFAAKERGFFLDQCLDVSIIDGNGVFGGINITAADSDFGIPWFLQFLELVDGGSPYIHISQIFQRPAWRYFGMPVLDELDPSAVTKSTVRNFGDMRNGVKFGIPRPYLETPLKSLLLKYGKTFCGATDWRTGENKNCTGTEDIEFVVYGRDINNISTLQLPFFQGMAYNELGRLLLLTDDQGNFKYTINTPGAPENVMVYSAYTIDNLLLPEDGLMIHAAFAENKVYHDQVTKFLTAAFKGWIYCRDNEEACVNIIAPNYGNTKQQIEHTLQIWQLREVNRVMWPAAMGIGVHNWTEVMTAARIGREIGSLVNITGNLTSASSLVTEAFTLEAHTTLQQEGLDISGADWVNKPGIKFCQSLEGVPTECQEDEGARPAWELALMISLPILAVLVLLALMAWHTYRLRRRLEELEASSELVTLDLEAPITKVRNLIRKLIGSEGERITPELTQELQSLMSTLQGAHDMNMPDLQRQLLRLSSSSDVYSGDLALFLVETTMQGEVQTHRSAVLQAISSGSTNSSFTDASCKMMCMKPKIEDTFKSSQLPKRETQDMYNFILSVHPEADDMLHEIGINPSLDMLTFSSLGNSELLITVAFHIFRTVHNLVLPLGLDDTKLMNFLKRLEAGMHGPQLHNVRHAADTMSRASAMIRMAGMYQQCTMDMKRQLAAALLACIIPDYCHPGRTNVFHIKRESRAAVLFNEQHVNENNAVHVALNILRDPKCNFIESWTEDEQHEFRSTVIQLVLGSDTDSHFELFTRFQMRVNTGTEGYSGSLAAAFYRGCDHKTRLLILQLVVVCAMHGDAVLPFEVHKKWVQMKQDELFGQGDEELQLGLPISGLMDRQRPGIADRTAQVGWLDIIVIPLFQQFCHVFKDCHILLQKCKDNRDRWEQEQPEVGMNKSHLVDEFAHLS